MLIQVIGAGCKNCAQLYQNVQEAVSELGIEAEIQKVEDLVEMVQLGVMSAPSVLVDGKLLVGGHVPKVKTLKELLASQLVK